MKRRFANCSKAKTIKNLPDFAGPDTQRLVLNAEHSSRRVFRNTFLLVMAIGFPVFGYYFAQRFGEPYPWLIMPDFAGDRRGADGNFAASRVGVVVAFADGGKETLSLGELFHPSPDATASRIYADLIRPKPTNQRTREEILGTPETSRFYYLKRYVQPGIVARKFNERPATPHPETVDWLSDRVAALFPDRAAAELRFERTVTRFDSKGAPLPSPPETEIETVIQLTTP